MYKDISADNSVVVLFLFRVWFRHDATVYSLTMTWVPFPEKYAPLCVGPSKQGPAPWIVAGFDIGAPFILKLRTQLGTPCFGRPLN